ncbi:uncharacterized protein LOC125657029 [Ostrea edulis]|uniref:uncharacterized protein LOC125657029 n=1 Tax=Ostrea edulis TaxID=37623 RepID=UPI0024AFD077|nr:uncharacterized protein LOC125657029 [Ostrea edulis]
MSMYILLTIIGFTLATDMASEFRRILHMNTTDLDPFLLKSTASLSEIRCVSECQMSMLCSSALFNNIARRCYLYSVPATTTPGMAVPSHYRIYRRIAKCEEFGYVVIDGTTQCLKLHRELKKQKGAIDDCEKSGGHLLRITSELMFYFTINEISLAGLAESFLYIDGNRRDEAWTFSDGSDIHILLWAPAEPNATNEDCLILFRSEYYNMNCETPWFYICERPMFL